MARNVTRLVSPLLALVLLALAACQSSGGSARRYDFNPGPIAQKYLQVGLVRPPDIVNRRSWSDEMPRGTFRTLRDPKRIIIACEPGYDPFNKDSIAPFYLAMTRERVWVERGWGDIPYHYYIAAEDAAYAGRPESMQAVTVTDVDLSDALVVSLMGCYETIPPDPKTMSLLADLLAHLCDKHRIHPSLVVPMSSLDETTRMGQYVLNYFNSGWIERETVRRIEEVYSAPPTNR